MLTLKKEFPARSSDDSDEQHDYVNGRSVTWHTREDHIRHIPYDYKRSQSFHNTQQRGPWNNEGERFMARPSLASALSLYASQQLLLSTQQQQRSRRVSSIQMENVSLLRRLNRDLESSASNYSRAESSMSDEIYSSDSSIRLEEHIKLHHLQKLLQIFKSHLPQQPVDIGEKKSGKVKVEETAEVKQSPGMMTLQEFTATISGMLGTTRWNDQMEMLFHKVDTACDGFVDWNEFCTYMLLQMREIEHIQKLNPTPFASPPVFKQIFHNKQETTTKCIIVENPPRILTVSKVGAIGVWDFELRLLKTYSLASDVMGEQQQTTRRRFHTWVTDVVYMRNNQKVALTTSSREIYFYDVSTSIYTIEFCLYAIPNVPICAHYWYNKASRNSHSMLLFGDDTGAAHILHFHAPQSRLFQKSFTPQQGTQRVYFNELPEHRKYVTYEFCGKVHNDVVRRILYVPQTDVIISSSASSSTSLVMMDIHRKKKPYVFKINKGVECFDYSKALNILVTGSLDHLVRIWNPYVVARPVIILQGHSTGVCDVVINEAFGQIVTYSKDVVIKVWDIKEHHCLQTVCPKFPTLQPGRIPDHGEFPLSLHSSPHDVMLVTCSDSVALYKMGRLEPKAEAPTTHDEPLCGAAYNPLFHQVVTAGEESSVCVWDIETGSRSLKFSNAHDQEEITCIAFDDSYRRLFTGARDGTIKVWNFQNGNCLHELEPVDEAEVSGIMSFLDRTILAVGWSRKIVLYDDSDPDTVNIAAKTYWKAGQLHQDDILCADHCPPNLLATGSYDGCIIAWNEDTQQVYMKLREGKQKSDSKGSNGPIDGLLFLVERSKHSKKNRATLLSSESGNLFWWCLFGCHALLGCFRATDDKDGSVLAMCSSADDNYLITADTSGHVSVWDIEHYCVTDQQQHVVTETPTRSYHWKAHDGAVVSVGFIEHELQAMVITGSVDKTARLWTLEGRLIGTFGQKRKWNLKRPLTYQYPKNPWDEIVEAPEPGHAHRRKEVENGLTSNSATDEAPPEQPTSTEDLAKLTNEQMSDEKSDDLNSMEQDGEEKSLSTETNENIQQEGDETHFDENFNNDDDFDENFNADETLERYQSESRDKDRRMTTDSCSSDVQSFLKSHQLYKQNRSKTVANIQLPKKEKILGSKAEMELTRKTASRQQRRYRVGNIDRKTTARFGNLCSPFQALAIKETDNVSFESEMPMSQRMLANGMNCHSEADLWNLPLSNLSEFNDAEHARPHNRRRHHQHRNNLTPRRLPPISSSSTASLASSLHGSDARG